MKQRHQILLGLKSYNKAVHLLFSSKLWLFLLVPIALNIIFWLLGSYVQNIMHQYIEAKVQMAFQDFFNQYNWVKRIVSAGVWLLNKLIFFVLYGYFCGYLILLSLSPILSIVSEKTEQLITGKRFSFSVKQFVKDILRSISLAFRNGFLQTVWWIVITVCSIIVFFIPLLGVILIVGFQFILFVVGCYFYGFSFIDYSMERRKRSISQTVHFMGKHKGVSIGIGFIFAITLSIPFCGSTLAGFIAIVSVIAATIAIIEIETNEQTEQTKQLDGNK